LFRMAIIWLACFAWLLFPNAYTSQLVIRSLRRFVQHF
jgi:hypothetical protein